MSILNPFEVYRTFRIYEVGEGAKKSANAPRTLFHVHRIEVGGFSALQVVHEPVVYGAHSGGFNPVYGETIEAVKQRIDACTKGMNADGSYPEDEDFAGGGWNGNVAARDSY